MRITWMPDNGSMKVYNVEKIEDFLNETGFKIHGTYEGPGMYVTTDGKPSRADIAEGIDNPFGSINGSIIVR